MVDFVIPWVDGNDPKWLEEKKQYDNLENNVVNNSDARFRDSNFLKYWFRGVEKHANWVNKIHFITYGHVPDWLNVNHPKLNIVNHKDYLDEKYLPTYSSITIELSLHKIESLSENFVYFNDDCFIIDQLQPEDFFIDGLPVDEGLFRHVDCSDYSNDHPHILLNNVGFINRNFNFRDCMSHHKDKFVNDVYGELKKHNEFYSQFSWFPGFYMLHLPQPFKKKIFKEVWDVEGSLLDEISQYKFRNAKSVNQYIFRAWQMLKGEFVPSLARKNGRAFYDLEKEFNEVIRYLINKERPMIVINDNVKIPNEKYYELSEEVNLVFEKLFPNKSSFEV